jgi:hypothetical protein
MLKPWIPNLTGQVSQDTEYAIRNLHVQVYKLANKTTANIVEKKTDINAILQQSKIQAPLNLPSSITSPNANTNEHLLEITLSAGTTAINFAAGNPGDGLAVFLTQPGGGGGKITWNAIFKLVGSNDNDTRASKVSAYYFKSRTDGSWWLVSMVLGRP